MNRPILHATDFSSASRPAFAKAVALAKANRAKLVITHVLTPELPLLEDGYMSAALYRERQAAARRYGQTHLDQLVTRAKHAGVRARALLLEGSPADRVVRAARSRRAHMIVIGTHGRTGLARLMVGSVANGIVSHARCPVLTVRGK